MAWRGSDDVGFIAALIEDVSKQTPIDSRRIYIYRLFNGGMLAHHVATNATDTDLGFPAKPHAVIEGADVSVTAWRCT